MVAYGRRPKRNQRESAYVSRQRTWRTLPEPSSTASEAGLLKPKIASEYRLNRSTVYDQLMEKLPYARISTKARTAQKAYLIPEASAYLNYTQESLN